MCQISQKAKVKTCKCFRWCTSSRTAHEAGVAVLQRAQNRLVGRRVQPLIDSAVLQLKLVQRLVLQRQLVHRELDRLGGRFGAQIVHARFQALGGTQTRFLLFFKTNFSVS